MGVRVLRQRHVGVLRGHVRRPRWGQPVPPHRHLYQHAREHHARHRGRRGGHDYGGHRRRLLELGLRRRLGGHRGVLGHLAGALGNDRHGHVFCDQAPHLRPSAARQERRACHPSALQPRDGRDGVLDHDQVPSDQRPGGRRGRRRPAAHDHGHHDGAGFCGLHLWGRAFCAEPAAVQGRCWRRWQQQRRGEQRDSPRRQQPNSCSVRGYEG
mmetsp:Transcript_9897/g.19457  ORF Transcript_9897/g.19457 Transcript_9897/m.19457 type:complete len:212 (+) Transcript_9897:560-1195(+)